MDALELLHTRESATRLQEPAPDAAALAAILKAAVRAPLIVIVAARVQPGARIPENEQILSAAAAAQNIMLAAHALGYGAMWKTGDAAYDSAVKEALGLQSTDAIVGFMYLGTRVGGPSPTVRPVAEDFMCEWP